MFLSEKKRLFHACVQEECHRLYTAVIEQGD